MTGIVGKLTQGAVDAGFTYVTDVQATKGKLKAIALPARLQPVVAYGVAIVRGTAHPAQARAFINGLLSGSGQADLSRLGFLPAAGEVSRRAWFPLLLGAALAVASRFSCFRWWRSLPIPDPGRLIDSLGDPTAIDALKLSLETTSIALAVIVLAGTPAALPPCHPLVSAAARSWSRWSSCRSCCRLRWRGSGCSRRSGPKGSSAGVLGHALVLEHGRCRCRADIRLRSVLPAPGPVRLSRRSIAR